MTVHPAKYPDRNDKILALHRGGYSAGLILQMMPNVTLNMINGVIGRAKRKGLLPAVFGSTHKLSPHAMGGNLRARRRPSTPLRLPAPPAISTNAGLRPQPAPAKADPIPVAIDAPPHVPRPKPCAFPIGDPKLPGFRFCGEPTREGSSYCAPHHARCWTVAPRVKPLPEGGRRGRHTVG